VYNLKVAIEFQNKHPSYGYPSQLIEVDVPQIDLRYDFYGNVSWTSLVPSDAEENPISANFTLKEDGFDYSAGASAGQVSFLLNFDSLTAGDTSKQASFTLWDD